MSIDDRLKTLKELRDMAWGLRVKINEDLARFENDILMLELKEERLINDELQHQQAALIDGMRNFNNGDFLGGSNGLPTD